MIEENNQFLESTSIDFLNEYLVKVISSGGTDLHLEANQLPTYRLHSQLIKMKDTVKLTYFEATELSYNLLSDYQRGILDKQGDVDTSYHFKYKKKVVKTRVNVYKTLNGYGFALRILSPSIPTIDDLRLPYVVKSLLKAQFGLIVVCGPTGSGKTTTIASMLQYINKNNAKHIVTIEDPIEYEFKSEQAFVSQREVGRHCSSFSKGLKAALREDPDIILVGEMRDKETISIALAAAETGHLVFTTLHSANVVQAIDRLIQYFPENEQSQVRNEIANSLRAVIAQRLLKKNGGGVIAAFEVILNTAAISNVIRTGNTFSIYDYLTEGMQTFEDSYQELKLRNFIL